MIDDRLFAYTQSMNKLRTFFQTLLRSSTDPNYGQDIVKAPSTFSWKYFLLLNLIATLVIGAKILVPVSLFDAGSLIKDAAQAYPAELEVTGDQTGLHINQPLPYAVPFPENFKGTDEVGRGRRGSNIPLYLVTFARDEDIEGIEGVREYDSFAVLTQTTVYFRGDEDRNEMKVYEMPEFEQPFVINRSVVNNLMTTIAENPFIKQRLYVPLIGVASLLFIYPATLFVHLLTLAIYSLVMLVIVSLFMKTKTLGYSKLFQLGLHTITPVMIVAFVLDALGYSFFHGWLYFLAFAVWTGVMITRLGEASKATAVSKPKTKRVSSKKK